MKIRAIAVTALIAVMPIAGAANAQATTLTKVSTTDRNHAITIYGSVCSIAEAQTAEEKRFITSFCNPKTKTNAAANRLGYCTRWVMNAKAVSPTCLRDVRRVWSSGI